MGTAHEIDATSFRVDGDLGSITQGSSCLATLGCMAQSRWDCDLRWFAVQFISAYGITKRCRLFHIGGGLDHIVFGERSRAAVSKRHVTTLGVQVFCPTEGSGLGSRKAKEL